MYQKALDKRHGISEANLIIDASSNQIKPLNAENEANSEEKNENVKLKFVIKSKKSYKTKILTKWLVCLTLVNNPEIAKQRKLKSK